MKRVNITYDPTQPAFRRVEDITESMESGRSQIVTIEGVALGAPVEPQATASAPPARASGPGTELKKLLGRFGIKSTPNCSCNARAAQMDVWGPDECERRLDEIVDWLGEEAQRRKLPFSRLVAAQVVKLAIRRARPAAS